MASLAFVFWSLNSFAACPGTSGMGPLTLKNKKPFMIKPYNNYVFVTNPNLPAMLSVLWDCSY